ncbi:lactonase family protein [Neorhizobium lilium]|nr:lactonase family protein [Neorhizobium lilium]
MILVIGSYTDSLPHVQAKGSGVSLLSFDRLTGEISPLFIFGDLRNPTYLALSHDRSKLYAVEKLSEPDGAGVATLNLDIPSRSISLADRLPAHGDSPCHIAIDEKGKRLFVSNYMSGNLVVYELDDEGLPKGRIVDIRRSGSGPVADRQEASHVHQAVLTPNGRHVLVCDLGADEVARYRVDESLIDPLPDMVTKVGSGSLPRHLVFSPNGRYVHVVHELANTITSYEYGASGLRSLGEVSTLPAGYTGQSAAAAIRVHPQGRFLYASNRGHDSIAGFELVEDDGSLRPIGHFATRGRAPRDFAIDPSGRWLVAANQDSHALTVFSIDPTSGALTPVGEPFEIGSPVCVLFAEE